jgi:hypothetical protein
MVAMKETFEAPRNLTDAEWDVLAQALGETKFGCVVETMRRRNNQPTAAQNVLPEDEINSGHRLLAFRQI